MQWEEKDLCLASSNAGAQLELCKISAIKTLFCQFCWLSRLVLFPSLVRGVRLCLDWRAFLILIPFVLETVKT